MLYAALKPIVTASLQLYFRRIKRCGLDQIDNNRPILILANHTASFMDAILVACFVRRRIYFFARGDVFGNKWADRLLRSIGLLPIYRISEGREKLHLNDSSNEEALKILNRGGAVLIFCEGSSDTAKRLLPLKKGPFRLAANAATTLPDAPVIIPLGINYITPTEPGADVFLEAGRPIETAHFLEVGNEGTARSATNMMRATQMALTPVVWHTERAEDDELATMLLRKLQEVKPAYSFEDTQRLIARLNLLDFEAAESLRKEVAGIALAPKLSVTDITVLLAGSLFALVGYAFHAPVTLLAALITRKKVEAQDFIAPVFLSIALVFMMFWYLLWLIIGLNMNATLTAAFIPGVALCGIFYLKVYRPRLHKAHAGKRAGHSMPDALKAVLDIDHIPGSLPTVNY